MQQPAGRFTSKGQAWLIVGVLACAQAVNQADKAVVGLAAEPIMRELHLSTAEYGLVAGSLFATFSLGGIAVGFLAAPRFAPRVILTAMLLVWSLAQLPVVLAASLPVLVASRLILGAGEGGGAPTVLNMAHEWFPDDRRGLPGAMILFGGTVGALIAAPALTYCISHYGWRSAFLACSVAGLLVMGAWLAIGRDGPYLAQRLLRDVTPSDAAPVDRPGLVQLLVRPAIIRCFITGFCGYWVVGFTVGWMAPYVRSQGGVPLDLSGWVMSAIYLGEGLILLGVAGLSQWLFARGHGPVVASNRVIAGCLFGSAAAFAAIAFVEAPWLRLLGVTIATGLPLGVFPLIAAVVSGVVPAERYRLMTIMMSSITLSGLLSPPLIGAWIDLNRPDGWRIALLSVAVVGVIGGITAIGRRTRP